jgi:hypothetical protein
MHVCPRGSENPGGISTRPVIVAFVEPIKTALTSPTCGTGISSDDE